MLACLSRRRSWVQIPSGTLKWHGTRTGIAAKLKPWCLRVRLPPVPLTKCVGWALASPSGCKPPASGCAGSGTDRPKAGLVAARRTDNTARSSNGRIPGLQPGDAGSIPVRATDGEVVELVDTRRSERRAQQGRGSSSLPFVTRLQVWLVPSWPRAPTEGWSWSVCPVRYRDLQLDAGGPVLIRAS